MHKTVTPNDGKRLPNGYVQITSESAPERLKEGNYLVPRLVHEDFYKKLEEQEPIERECLTRLS